MASLKIPGILRLFVAGATIAISFISSIDNARAEGFAAVKYWQIDEVVLKEDLSHSVNADGCIEKSAEFPRADVHIYCPPMLRQQAVDGCTYSPVDAKFTVTLCPIAKANFDDSYKGDKVTVAHIHQTKAHDFDGRDDLRPSSQLAGIQFLMKCSWISHFSESGRYLDGFTNTQCSERHLDIFFSKVAAE